MLKYGINGFSHNNVFVILAHWTSNTANYDSVENPETTSGKHEFPVLLSGDQLYLKKCDRPVN